MYKRRKSPYSFKPCTFYIFPENLFFHNSLKTIISIILLKNGINESILFFKYVFNSWSW